MRKLLLFLLLATFCAAQSDANQVFYTVSLERRAEHMVHVSARVPAGTSRTLALPVWNALYQVRDFSQFVEKVSAHDDASRPLAVTAVDKTTWRVNAPGAYVFEYDIYANDPGPFGAQLNDHHAFLNLAQVLVYPTEQRDQPMIVGFTGYPAEWKIATALQAIGTFAGTKPVVTFQASSYDNLVDSPVEVGTFASEQFADGRAQFRVVVDADSGDYDLKAIADQARRLALTEVEWMQDRPFDRYVFIYHFPRGPAGSGMEHAFSTAIDSSAQRVKQDPRSVASVTAHEFFHLWNVKRIRPQSLEPIDYSKEQYSRALWWSEGVTSTVGDWMLVRAGFWNEKQYVTALARQIQFLESRPARLTQSVEESSLDTWYDKYPFYGQPERSISYYNKGEILGVLLDLSIREATHNRKSLRDVFHALNANYARRGRFFPDSAGIRETAEAVCSCALGKFFADYVAGVVPLPYDDFFKTVGLRVQKTSTTVADAGFRTRRAFGQPVGTTLPVSQVEAGSAAEQAGLKLGDVVQEVNGKPIAGSAESQLSAMKPGEEVRLRVSGRGGQRELSFKLGSHTVDMYELVDAEDVTPEQRATRAAWIRGD